MQELVIAAEASMLVSPAPLVQPSEQGLDEDEEEKR
jgi:hypothetical protein